MELFHIRRLWNESTFVPPCTQFFRVVNPFVVSCQLFFGAFFFPSFLYKPHTSKYSVYCSLILQFTRNTSNHQEILRRILERIFPCDSRFIQIINLRWICYEDRNSRVSTASMIGFTSLFWCKRIYSKSHADETSDRNTNLDRAVLHACLHVYLRGISIDWFGDCTVRFRLYSSSSRNYWNFRFVLFSSFFSLFWFAYTR